MTNINAPCIVCGFIGDADETDLGWVCSEKLSCFDRLKSNPPQLRSRPKDLNPIEPPPQREGEEKRSAAAPKCVECGATSAFGMLERGRNPETDWRCGDSAACRQRSHFPKSPFDPNPRTLDKAQNGFIMCRVCESVQLAAGHECGDDIDDSGWIIYYADLAHDRTAERDIATDRAEHAESLLCAMAWDEGSGAIEVRHGEGTDPSRCLFCGLSHHQEAAR